MKYIIKRMSILFGICLIIFTLTSCNDKKDDPLYIDALSFFCDKGDNNGHIEIDHESRDVYLEVNNGSFCLGASFEIVRTNKNGKTTITSYWYGNDSEFDAFYEDGEKIRILEASSKYKYDIYSIPISYGGVYLNHEEKQSTNYSASNVEDFPNSFCRVDSESYFKTIHLKKDQQISLLCLTGAPSFDLTPFYNGEVDIVSLNPSIQINAISKTNLFTGNLIYENLTLINLTYLGEENDFCLSDIVFGFQ